MAKKIRPLVVGNWKMNGLRCSLGVVKKIADDSETDRLATLDMVLCLPATLLYVATTLCEDVRLQIGGQDCHQVSSGAHTGDISADMIADCLGAYVIVGHCERRKDHGETNAIVKAKARAAINAGLVVIVCVGETEAERLSGKTLDILKTQLDQSVPDHATAQNTVIAYEPVWAIGTGRVPDKDDIKEIHAFLRTEMVKRFEDEGRAMRILYGGSVKPDNAEELMAISNVNGALVGGASLKADDFLSICYSTAICIH